MASNLLGMASNLLAMASNLLGMASNLITICDGLQPTSGGPAWEVESFNSYCY